MSAYIISAARTPIGKFLGGLSAFTAPQLGATSLRAALERSGLDPSHVDEVIMGNVVQAGIGQAPARQAALAAGLPAEIPAVTVNKVCGSGLKAVMLADQAIRCGDARVVLAGGMESMSQAPHLLKNSRVGTKFGNQQLVDALLHDGLWCASEQVAMGVLAEQTAKSCDASRDQQDEFSVESHRRATAAIAAGYFDREIVPVEVRSKRESIRITKDEGPREDASLQSLSKLAPAFSADGTVTAGNASQLSDGAAALLVVNEEVAQQQDVPWKARIVASATSGVAPKDLFIAPVPAIEKVLRKASLKLSDIECIELNEAFAAQCLACMKPLKMDRERVNPRGGAIALGHPIGASGARVLTTLLYTLADRGGGYGLAALCLGGGNAVAMVVEMARPAAS